jgi:hypothetical protein
VEIVTEHEKEKRIKAENETVMVNLRDSSIWQQEEE